MLLARSTNNTVIGNAMEHSQRALPQGQLAGLSVKNSFDGPIKNPHNIFPTIDQKKKASIGAVSKNSGSPNGLVKASFYNPNNIGHYKRDYLKMVQKEAEKQISDAIRYTSPLRYKNKAIDLNQIQDVLYKQSLKEQEQNAFEKNYQLGAHQDAFDSSHMVYSNKNKNDMMKALTKSKAFDPRFTTMTQFSKKTSLESQHQKQSNANANQFDEAMYLNRLMHDTRRKAQSVLKTKQFQNQDVQVGGGDQSIAPSSYARPIDVGSKGSRANSMLDQIDSRGGPYVHSQRNPNNTTGNFSFNQSFKPFGTDVMPGYSLKQQGNGNESDGDYFYSPFKNKLRKQLFVNGQSSNEMYKSAMHPQTMSTIQSTSGLEDKTKKFMQNNRDNLGVWDAIAIADAQRYKMEQNEKRKILRKKHVELQNFYAMQAKDKQVKDRVERDWSIAQGQNIVARDLEAVQIQRKKELMERKALKEELDIVLINLEEKKKLVKKDIEKEKQVYEKCDLIQAERHNDKLREYKDRKDKTFQAKEENLNIMAQKSVNPQKEVEDMNLVNKITTTPGQFQKVQKLQSIDKDFECFQFENNGFQFKNQLNTRLDKAKKIYDLTNASPEKNHALFDKDREKMLSELVNTQMTEYEAKKNREGLNKQAKKRAAAEKNMKDNINLSHKLKNTIKTNVDDEMSADKQFIQTTNNFHQQDQIERFQKKKQTQAHLANFYQQQHISRIEEENDKHKLLQKNEFLLNKKLIQELELLPQDQEQE